MPWQDLHQTDPLILHQDWIQPADLSCQVEELLHSCRNNFSCLGRICIRMTLKPAPGLGLECLIDQLSCPAKVKKGYTHVETFSFALEASVLRLTLRFAPAPAAGLELPIGPAGFPAQGPERLHSCRNILFHLGRD